MIIFNENGNANSIGFINNLIWNRMKENINTIINLIVDNFVVYNTKFELEGIISNPYSGHYTAFIINLKEDLYLLEKANNYYYDDISNYNEIVKLNIDYKEKLRNDLPLILIYRKTN